MKFAVVMQRGRFSQPINWTPAAISEAVGFEDAHHVSYEGTTRDGDPLLGICSDGPNYRAYAERLAQKVAGVCRVSSWRVVPKNPRHGTFPVHHA